MKLFIILVFSPAITLACDTPESGPTPTIRIEAPDARIVIDGEAGVVDIQADDTKVYADKTGRVEIIAPGDATMRHEPQ